MPHCDWVLCITLEITDVHSSAYGVTMSGYLTYEKSVDRWALVNVKNKEGTFKITNDAIEVHAPIALEIVEAVRAKLFVPIDFFYFVRTNNATVIKLKTNGGKDTYIRYTDVNVISAIHCKGKQKLILKWEQQW